MAFAAAGLMIIHCHTSMAVFMMLRFFGYLRPSECTLLVGLSLVPPIRSHKRTFQSEGILTHDAELGIAGITGITVESVLMDRDVWIFPLLQAMHYTRPENTSKSIELGP
jgi:hypothetical protein